MYADRAKVRQATAVAEANRGRADKSYVETLPHMDKAVSDAAWPFRERQS